MTLTVPFSINVKVHELEKNYSGKVTLSPARAEPRIFYFLVLNPYAGTEAEFGIFEDEQMSAPFAEAVGEPVQGYNPHTGRPITNYDFGLQIEGPKIGLVTVTTMIISEAIYQSEISYRKEGFMDKMEQAPTFEFSHVWQSDFRKAPSVYHSFLKDFKLS